MIFTVKISGFIYPKKGAKKECLVMAFWRLFSRVRRDGQINTAIWFSSICYDVWRSRTVAEQAEPHLTFLGGGVFALHNLATWTPFRFAGLGLRVCTGNTRAGHAEQVWPRSFSYLYAGPARVFYMVLYVCYSRAPIYCTVYSRIQKVSSMILRILNFKLS